LKNSLKIGIRCLKLLLFNNLKLLKYNPSSKELLNSYPQEVSKIQSAIDFLEDCKKAQSFDQEEDFVFLPDHKNELEKLQQYTGKAIDLGFDFIIFVGIGGANLGVMTVYNALFPNKHIYFIENIDPDFNEATFWQIKNEYKNGLKALLIVASKSGLTSETMANFASVLALFKELESDWQKRTFITTTRNSVLDNIAAKENVNVIHTHELLVDRYSVFGLGSLFALALSGINTSNLLKGAFEINKNLFNKNLSGNPAALNALDVFHHLQNGKPIYNTFIFSQKLETFGRWQRQLIGESLGKDGKGVVPLFSIGTTDLHSMTQLYLDGQRNIFTSFVSIEKFIENKMIDPHQILAETELQQISGKTHAQLYKIIEISVKTAYKKQNLPFSEILLPELNETTLGSLLQTTMLTVVFLSKLLSVNAFNQDAVELYKQEIRKLL